jgi:hypothetical protein
MLYNLYAEGTESRACMGSHDAVGSSISDTLSVASGRNTLEEKQNPRQLVSVLPRLYESRPSAWPFIKQAELEAVGVSLTASS